MPNYLQRRARRSPLLFAFSLGVLVIGFAAILAATSPASAQQPRQVTAPLTSTLVINEVYDSNNPANEYFELYNASVTATVDLTSYVIYNSDVNPPGINYLSRLPSNLRVIGPGQYLAIGPAQLGTTTLVGDGLSGYDYLALVNSASETTVDLVNWGGAPNPNWYQFARFQTAFFYDNIPTMPAADGPRSLSRCINGYDTDTGADWCQLPASPGRGNPISTPTPGGASPTPTSGCEDRYEPDDTSAQARILEQNTEQVHTLCRAGGTVKDRDWFFFDAVAGKLYTMLTKDLTGPVDTVITLYDYQGNALAENDDYQPGQSLASRIDYTFSAGGRYFLQVRDKRSNGGLGYQYTVALISTGAIPATTTATATATVNPLATPTPGVCYDAYEPDGVPETAKLLNIGTTQRHSICPVGDADWVRFFARAGKVYTIRTGNLGPGLDTFMFLFDSDAATMLAQNDDGGDSVASRIDFYPQKDGWYYAQVKNAGDIGGSEMVYELSLAVVPGVPQPAGTATTIIAPPVTVTVGPTQQPLATKPPVPTPTQGEILPTPTPVATTSVPAQEPTAEPSGTGGPVGEATPPVIVPGVPGTGHPASRPAAVNPPATRSYASFAPVLFRVFYDGDKSSAYRVGEGVRGLQVYFLNADAAMAASGVLQTGDGGLGKATLPVASHRVFIPYLGINIELTKFPAKELHQFWLNPVTLPDRVP